MRERVHRASRWFVLISLVASSVLGYVSSQILDEDSFASLISKSLDEPDVRSLFAEKAIDVALDASNADAALAEALPDDISLIATPAIELAKPTVAEAGAVLLGVEAVGTSVEAAARSVHRQTIASVLAEEETDVTLNALPVLVVVADGIAGDAGARAAVGLDLPEGVSEIDLGTNQSPLWSVVRSLSIAAGLAVLLLLISLAAYFFTAPSGHRLDALRRLGHTWARAGVVVLLIAWLLLLAATAASIILLSPGEALTFSTLSVGGVSVDGSLALASVVLGPLIGSARQAIIVGGLLVAAAHLLGSSRVAVALRASLRTRDLSVARSAILEALPQNLRRVRTSVWLGLGITLLAWPAITSRVAVTVTVLALISLVLLRAATGTTDASQIVRSVAELPTITSTDDTARSRRAQGLRRWLISGFVAVALIWPDYSTSGLVLLVVLVSAVMALSYWWEGRIAESIPAPVETLAEQDERWTPRRIGFIAGALILCVAVVLSDGDSVPELSASELALGAPTTCNGYAELCDLRLDEVALAGTHNSMSSSVLGWELANHGPAIPAQLDGGVRALLIDVLEWTAANDLDSFSNDAEARAIAEAALAGSVTPEDGLWMCHALCQLGATPFRDFLGDLSAFIETHPDDVVIVVIQDETDASSIKSAIEDSGLHERAFSHVAGTPWPTLGEMIAADERLVFLAENEADAEGWYQLAFDGNVVETDFSYAVIEDFECAPNRGGDGDGLFMINHWVETGLPVPAEADAVNSAEVLRSRVDECVRTRNRGPGIIAVNFWERGDLIAFVDELNGVG